MSNHVEKRQLSDGTIRGTELCRDCILHLHCWAFFYARRGGERKRFQINIKKTKLVNFNSSPPALLVVCCKVLNAGGEMYD